MKKKISYLFALVLMLLLTACSPNMKAYMNEVNKVSNWEGVKTTARGNIDIKIKSPDVSKNDVEEFNIPMTVTSIANKEVSKATVSMDLKSVFEKATKEELKGLTIPEKFDFTMFVDGGKVLYKVSDFNALLGENSPFKDFKEEYVAIDYSDLTKDSIDVNNKDVLKYVRSKEFEADIIKIFETALKGYDSKIEMKLEGNTFTVDTNLKDISNELKNFSNSISKNWDKTSELVIPMAKKLGIDLKDEDIKNAFVDYDKNQFAQLMDNLFEQVKDSKIKYVTTFDENKYSQKTEFMLKADGVEMNFNFDTINEKSNEKVTPPTSVKTISMTEYMMLFMGNAEPITVLRVEGAVIPFENQAPVIENGRTLVPIRAISENLGAEVKWDANARKVEINKDGKKIELVIDSKVAKVDGKEVTLDTNAKIMNSTTMVPVRFVAETYGFNVKFNNESPMINFVDLYTGSEKDLEKKIEDEQKKLLEQFDNLKTEEVKEDKAA